MSTTIQPLRAAVLADSEIRHLASTVKGLNSGGAALNHLPLSYWLSRIVAIESGYALVPAQRLKLTALRRELDALIERQARVKPEGQTLLVADRWSAQQRLAKLAA